VFESNRHPCRVSIELLREYVSGRLGASAAGALELHLIACAACQQGVAAAGGADANERARHESTWARLALDIEPAPAVAERLAIRLGLPPHVATLVASAPPLRTAWVLILTALLGLSVLAAYMGQGPAGTLAFLVLAPIVPVIGVAIAYGQVGEPVGELAGVAPYPAFKVVLLRTMTVVTAALVPAIPLSFLLPAVGPSHLLLWLLPAVAASTTTLAVATWIRPERAAAFTMLAWLAIAAPSATRARFLSSDELIARLPLFQPAAQVMFVTVAVLAVIVVVHRRALLGGDPGLGGLP